MTISLQSGWHNNSHLPLIVQTRRSRICTMTLVFPIVGLRHFMPEAQVLDFVTSLSEGEEVSLLYDNANAHDRYAIQAWMNRTVDGAIQKVQIGYVASDFAPVIRANYPDASLVYACVKHPDTSDWDTYFEAEMEVEQLTLPILPQRLELTPIANIPLPMVSPGKQLLFADIMAYGKEDLEADKVLSLAQKAKPFFGHGLSGEERAAYILMSAMLELIHSEWTPLTDAIWDMRMDMDATHRDAFKTPELCAQVMDEEMQMLKTTATSFFDQYAAVLKAGLSTKEQELKAHQQWLMALPDNLYAYINDRPQFASRLYYERFQLEELQAIYLHLLCIEWLQENTEDHLPDFAEQAIAVFSFWSYSASLAKKRAAVLAWRKAAAQETEPIATLAMRIKQLQKNDILKKPLLPFTQFVRELNLFLDQPIKQNSLRKRM